MPVQKNLNTGPVAVFSYSYKLSTAPFMLAAALEKSREGAHRAVRLNCSETDNLEEPLKLKISYVGQ